MIAFLVILRDAVLATLMGWLSAGTDQYILDTKTLDPGPTLVPVASQPCHTQSDLPGPEGA